MKVMISESAASKDPKLAALKDKLKEANAAYRKAQSEFNAAEKAVEKAGSVAEKAQRALDLYMSKNSVGGLLPTVGKAYNIMEFRQLGTDSAGKGWRESFYHGVVKIKEITDTEVKFSGSPARLTPLALKRLKEGGQKVTKTSVTGTIKIADLGKKYKFVAAKA